MSKIFKASRISVDEYNKVLIKTEKVSNKEVAPVEEAVVNEEDVTNILENAQNKADKIIKDAEANRASILEKAEKDKEEVFRNSEKEGYDAGYKKGYDEGVVAGSGTYNDLMAEVEEKIESYDKKLAQLLDDAEEQVVDLIVDIVENLTLNLFDIKPELVQILVKKGLENATVQNKVSIKVSNNDYDYVVEHKEELKKYLDSSKEIEILKDFSLKDNDCMLETEFGNIDCGLDQQLNSLKESIYCIFKDR